MNDNIKNDIVDNISKFLEKEKSYVLKKVNYEINNPGRTVANAWNKINPKTEIEIEDFYKKTDSYIYDLLIESSRTSRIEWRDSILFYLSLYEDKKTLLDYGGGVGTDGLYFQECGYDTSYYDLKGLTFDFAKYRFNKYNSEIKVLENKNNIKSYDSIVCLEVMEHLVDPIDTLKFLYTKLNKNGLLFLTQSFDLVSKDYPSHLKENQKYSKDFEKICVDLGFTILDKISNDRIYVLGKFGGVDIIVPTYNSYEYVYDCINSVIENTNDTPYRFVFVNDCSTDIRIHKFFNKIKRDKDIYIKNKKNLGFVKTTNIGLSQSKENDVVLLNTDTVVTYKWLSSIRKVIYKKQKYATANPLTNNASIYSILELSHLADNVNIQKIGKIINKSSMHLYPEIPVSVGFCMYIKREVLNKIGILDEIFERGYGEEGDFCMRCRVNGYSHILVDDAFVFHKGSVSMLLKGEIKKGESTIEAHEKILHKRYPDYGAIINNFIETRVFNNIKNSIIQSVTSSLSLNKRRILYVIHFPINGDNIGGTEFHLKDLVNNIDNKIDCYVLYIKDNKIIVEEYVDNIKTSYLFDIPYPLQSYLFRNDFLYYKYIEILKILNINLIHVQHLLNNSFDIIFSAKSLGIPIIMTIHDYYLISPDYNLLYRYKDEIYNKDIVPDSKYFEKKLLIKNFKQEDWQKNISKVISLVNLFIFPSESAKSEFSNVYNIKNSLVIEHGETLVPDKNFNIGSIKMADKKKFSILFLGYTNASQKGNNTLKKVITSLSNRGVEIHLLGTEELYWKNIHKQNLILHGSYKRNNVVEILKKINPDIIGLVSIWPETFSYTFSEALLAKIPVVTFPLGAVPERIKKYGGGGFILNSLSSDEFIKTIISLKKNNVEYKKLKNETKEIHVKTLNENIKEYLDLYEKYVYIKDLNHTNEDIKRISSEHYSTYIEEKRLIQNAINEKNLLLFHLNNIQNSIIWKYIISNYLRLKNVLYEIKKIR